MSKTYEFLKDCGVFFLSTVNDNFPASRPLDSVIEYENTLYFSTRNTKDVYSQLKLNPNIQIIALKKDTGDWVRITGKAFENKNLLLKQLILNECPNLQKKFIATSANFALFELENFKSVLNTNNKVIILDEK